MKKYIANSIVVVGMIGTLNSCSGLRMSSGRPQYYIDPVCNMKVAKGDSFDFKFKDSVYHFDSYNCRETFKMNPEKFIGNKCNAAVK
jgi:YHS domain-containing protein